MTPNNPNDHNPLITQAASDPVNFDHSMAATAQYLQALRNVHIGCMFTTKPIRSLADPRLQCLARGQSYHSRLEVNARAYGATLGLSKSDLAKAMPSCMTQKESKISSSGFLHFNDFMFGRYEGFSYTPSRLSQSLLEHVFGRIREKSGGNHGTTEAQYRAALAGVRVSTETSVLRKVKLMGRNPNVRGHGDDSLASLAFLAQHGVTSVCV
jgi:hypothetical protein